MKHGFVPELTLDTQITSHNLFYFNNSDIFLTFSILFYQE